MKTYQFVVLCSVRLSRCVCVCVCIIVCVCVYWCIVIVHRIQSLSVSILHSINYTNYIHYKHTNNINIYIRYIYTIYIPNTRIAVTFHTHTHITHRDLYTYIERDISMHIRIQIYIVMLIANIGKILFVA